ncbi:site-2 protease family protein [Patescibacteria group bacterium]|nr:site-2 protease family protein [Patescibacteria group bacterium]
MTIITILAVVFMLSLLIFIHELGHFLAAYKFGIKVEEFAIGMGPIFFKRDSKKFKTKFTLRIIPIGGFCKIKGENGENSDEKDSFGSKKIWKRAVVLSAGVFLNLLLAILFFYFSSILGTSQIITEDTLNQKGVTINSYRPIITLPSDGSLEDQLMQVYYLNKINDIDFSETMISNAMEYLENNEVNTFMVEDSFGEEKEIKVTSNYSGDPIENSYVATDIGFINSGIIKYSPIQAFPQAFIETGRSLNDMFFGIKYLFSNIFSGSGVPDGFAGPVGIAVVTKNFISQGFGVYIHWIAIVSLNLFLINLLPFPALDGGRLVFLAVEAIRGKPVKQEIEGWVNLAGFGLLMLLMIIITYKDIIRFIT